MNKITSFAIFIFILTGTVHAKDFGKQGQEFEISEKDLAQAFMDTIQSRLQEVDVQAIHEKALKEAFTNAQRPDPVKFVKEAKKYHSHIYDPVITLEEDIEGATGKLLAKKGDKIDPTLTIGNPDFGFLFINGDDPDHVAWAKNQDDSFDWVLVRGNPFTLAEQENKEWVGFDQGGTLCKKFKIKHVPCRVSPSGKEMLIEEIPIDD